MNKTLLLDLLVFTIDIVKYHPNFVNVLRGGKKEMLLLDLKVFHNLLIIIIRLRLRSIGLKMKKNMIDNLSGRTVRTCVGTYSECSIVNPAKVPAGMAVILLRFSSLTKKRFPSISIL